MAQPVWITPSGSLGTIPEGIFFQLPLLAYDPEITVNPSAVSTTGTTATFTFETQTKLPYEVDSQVVISGFSPTALNGTYTVVEASNTSVTVANNTQVFKYNVTSVSANGSTVTLNFYPRPSVPFVIGTSITVTGFAPSQYNGTYTVTAATVGSVSFSSTVADPITRLGTVTNLVLGTITNVTRPLYYEVISGTLPPGIQCEPTGLIIGIPRAVVSVQGVPEPVNRDITFKFGARVYTEKLVNGVEVLARLSDQTFTLTITGQDTPEWVTPAGQIAQYYDGSQITGLQLEYTDADPGDIVVVSLKAGSLPPGLSVSPSGLISGFIQPLAPIAATAGFSRDGQGYDVYPFDFSTRSASANYEFVLELSDGKSTSLRTFSIFVYSKDSMTADTTDFTADNTFITADVSPVRVPIITSPAPGLIGPIRNNNFFAVQFVGLDLDGDQVEYELGYDPGDSTLLPGLTLDPGTGWLYGYIPNLGLTDNTYNFYVRVYKRDNPTVISNPYYYSLEIIGPIDTDVEWISPSDLGTIPNGSTSTFSIVATNVDDIPLLYRLRSGSDSQLPQGLQLLPSGDIAGRVSFDTFALDGGTTTFDITANDLAITGQNTETTFDMKHTFEVNAYSLNGLVSVFKTFSITVVREYNEPYENLYIEAMPPFVDRDFVASLLDNEEIFQPDLIYRPTDPNFGKARKIVYNHAFGLTASTVEDYVRSLDINHYWKNLVLGEIEVAQAVDANDNVIYEVVYSRVVDNLLNSAGESVSKEVTLPYPINEADSTEIATVYPNSLINMRDQVIDTVGQVATILPLWMRSKQANGQVLGFTPAWVLTYAKPGKGNQLAYYIKTQFGERLNLVDFEVDRYELDRLLTKNWDPIADSTGGAWVPTPAETSFDLVTHYQLPEPNDSSFVFSGGTGYAVGDQIRILGSQLGGVDGTNDVTITVNTVDESGTIQGAFCQGFAPLLSTGDTYTNVSGTNITGTGIGATWDIVVVGADPTVFDGSSVRFIAPVDMYSNSQEYDKYLVFPRRNILG